MEKVLADVVQVRSDFALRNGLASSDRCTRDIARRMMEYLDGKHARKLKN